MPRPPVFQDVPGLVAALFVRFAAAGSPLAGPETVTGLSVLSAGVLLLPRTPDPPTDKGVFFRT